MSCNDFFIIKKSVTIYCSQGVILSGKILLFNLSRLCFNQSEYSVNNFQHDERADDKARILSLSCLLPRSSHSVLNDCTEYILLM